MSSDSPFDLRHTVATLAYRADKVLRDVPADFAGFRPAPGSRSALGLVAHLGDLVEWALRMTQGELRWEPLPQAAWTAAVDRFFDGLARLDGALASAEPDATTARRIFQGPVADALTHVGQLAMMRGMIGAAVRPESYARAHIAAGRVGRDQDPRRTEFDGDASPEAPPSPE